jgi:maltose 6'-phosphate phosphatase
VVARVLDELQPDIVALQECAQDRAAAVRRTVNPGVPIRDGNMALLLLESLRNANPSWRGAWDWAHYGWDKWEEGCAVLSRHPIRRADSRYVTRAQGTGSWKSRKPVAALVDVEGFGPVAAFSVHTGWWGDVEEPFEDTLDALTTWQTEFLEKSPGDCSLLTVGDFNQPAGGEGYEFLRDWTGWQDGWLSTHPEAMSVPTMGPHTDGWEQSSAALRIDYIFTRKEDAMQVIECERVFTDEKFGRVSDHTGVWAILRR